ncbi:tRNA (adenosine(37)-N6)-threonylcarbamoyltransferase complex transferase subunit TsaD [archaeon]|jgi:N6-L-threonylcarbamoyladenine synthase|nr:tRNA (adenosine(37)-N6)-threonylcarbamoyltransferase complex transferase subunit TsaD [archaeon]MBT4373988.1 tRNA (adenosine(37)-N6)-threonylcarbamoyltransferase complex transferase subunit TsaD [archaeon]MBT4532084.1 tRNA (adenosine(37)-N6)-threonylcarbamoyltransferase complex transferase subunit TsaD [archaeon]MBT7001974.1 tRNA (adenosine(37)-N6)-threonylcarbamoyltransferase complex transferase subunit TsaD [archaeon]MBT7282685.1 tRNA (adenosine(37)-N6)-threonylcarbamoyltransferase complex
MVIILGIESTAHTFGVGVVKEGKVLANKRNMYTTESGGIIPTESAQHHCECKNELYFEALDEAGLAGKENKIDAIAFSQAPGLAPCLLEGMKFAKELSKRLGKPIVGINHCIAHLEIGNVTGAKDPVMLYASGANTQIIAYAAGKYRIFGETLDLGVGNFIDTVARFAGMGFPGGPILEKLAKESSNYIELPYKVKGMDVAFAGIQTKLRQMIESGAYKLSDLAFSLQETVFAMLVETAERALAHTGKKELLLGGGVACNARLQEMCKIMCDERGCKFFVPEKPLLVDNAAMIAYLGEIMFKAKVNVFQPDELDKIDILPRQRTDEVNVGWKD